MLTDGAIGRQGTKHDKKGIEVRKEHVVWEIMEVSMGQRYC